MRLCNSLKTPAERKLWEAQRDNPESLETLRIGTPDPECGASWGPDQTIRGPLIRQILLGHGPSQAPCVVRLEGARISEELNLEGASLVCPLDLTGCYFDAAITLEQASAKAIYLNDCNIPRGVRADQLITEHNFDLLRCKVKSGVSLIGAHIGGQLRMDGSVVTAAQDGKALKFRSLTIVKGASLEDLTVEGLADISGSRFGRALKMKGAKFTKPLDGESLKAHRIHVDGPVNLNDNFSAEGLVDLTGSRVKGHLGLSGGRFLKKGGSTPEERVLDLSRVVVDQNAYLDNGFTATGTVDLLDARIKGSLHCEGGTFDNEADTAIYAAGIVVGRDIKLSKKSTEPTDDRSSFLAKGKVIFVDARVGGSLNCSGGIFHSKERALDVRGMQVESLIFTDGKNHFQAEGIVDLRRVRIRGTLQAGRSLTYDQARLRGLTYTSIEDQMALDERLKWLLRMPTANIPQIYRQLAAVKQADGYDKDAKKILMAGQDAHYAKRALPIRYLGKFFKLTVGYGYSPSRILVWLGVFELVGGILFSYLRHDMTLSPIFIDAFAGKPGAHPPLGSITGALTSTEHGYPVFQPWLYTLDLLLPVVKLRQSDVWIPHSAAEWCSMVFVIAGWILATSLVIGLGSVFARGRQNSSVSAF